MTAINASALVAAQVYGASHQAPGQPVQPVQKSAETPRFLVEDQATLSSAPPRAEAPAEGPSETPKAAHKRPGSLVDVRA